MRRSNAMARSSYLPLVAAVCLAALCVLPVDAYYVYYTSNCGSVCSPSVSSPTYSSCINSCNTCLLYWNCYSAFQPYFNGPQYYSYSCYCYWPWWAWLLFSIGCLLLVGACFFGVFFCLRRARADRENKQAVMAAQAAAGAGQPAPGYGPPPPGYGPPPPGYGAPPPPVY